jgi:hypothetical protein
MAFQNEFYLAFANSGVIHYPVFKRASFIDSRRFKPTVFAKIWRYNNNNENLDATRLLTMDPLLDWLEEFRNLNLSSQSESDTVRRGAEQDVSGQETTVCTPQSVKLHC